MENVLERPKEEIKRPVKLGFRKLESAQMVNKLNLLLSNYAVHYQKLRNFHWNVIGGDFFDIHEKFEEQYNFTKESIDTVAERIRVFGHHPVSTMKEYLELSEIKEVDQNFKSSMMVSEVMNDFEIILTHLTDVYDIAAEIGDIGTAYMIMQLIENLETKYWMFASFNKEVK